jgi:hypothetical protein
VITAFKAFLSDTNIRLPLLRLRDMLPEKDMSHVNSTRKYRE